MKYVKTLTLAAATVAMTVSASAQLDTIAGWDFSQFAFAGDNSLSPWPDYSQAGALNSNYTDITVANPVPGAAAGPAAGAFGTIFYNGTNGSSLVSNLGAFGGSEVNAISGNLSRANPQMSDGSFFNLLGSYNTLVANGQAGTPQDLGLAVGADLSIVFEGVTPVGYVGEDWQITFAALQLGASTAMIDWNYSTDGVLFTPLGVTTALSTVDTGFTVDFGAFLDGASNVYLRADITGVNSTNVAVFDNVGIATSVVVPEPSAYALIFGALALGFIIRRRVRA